MKSIDNYLINSSSNDTQNAYDYKFGNRVYHVIESKVTCRCLVHCWMFVTFETTSIFQAQTIIVNMELRK